MSLRAERVAILVAPIVCALAACDDGSNEAPPPPRREMASASEAPPPPPAVKSASTSVDSATNEKVRIVMPLIRKIAEDPVCEKAIEEQNAKKLSMDWIKKMDVEWTNATGITPFMKPYLENDCVTSLKKLVASQPAIVETFVMDDQGANVACVWKTSDFWQGDEDKWQRSFAGGAGAEFIDKPRFDESSQSYSVQVSLPVMKGHRAIGAITVGIALDRF